MSRHPIIVVEGPDGVGKTTLWDALCEQIGAKYVHLTYRFKDRMHLYHGAALKHCLLVSEKQPVVLDRWWASESVYAGAYRGGTKWPLMHRHLERIALRHGVSYVFCVPKDRTRYLEHYEVLRKSREEMYDEGMSRVYDGFSKVLTRLENERRPAVMTYDMFVDGEGGPDGKNFKDAVQRVIENAEDERALLPEWAKTTSFVNFSGSPSRAKILVVGDLRDPGVRRDYPPFADYSAKTLGLRWSTALDQANVAESDLAYTYLFDGQSPTATITAIRECSRHMSVVALGAHVARSLTNNLGVPVTATLTHPTLWGEDWDGTYIFKEMLNVQRD